MWNCLECFNENSGNAAFCAYCGSPRAVRQQNASTTVTNITNAQSPHDSALSMVAHPDFPFRTPAILRISEPAVRGIAALFGIALGIACSTGIYFLSDAASMTGRLFNLTDPFAAVPVLTMMLFFWGLAMCVVRYLRANAASSSASNALLMHAMEIAKRGGLDLLASELEVPSVEHSPLLRRLRAVTRHWAVTPSLQDADVLLQQHLYSDEENVRVGFSLVRTFIWALPVLGLLGTVAGVAVAVGGFAQFLSGDIEDVAVIKRSLVNVTAGLSYAFLTTLYGLAGALILMLIATALQTREEKLYASVQQKISNQFLPFLQSISPEIKGDISATSGLQEQLMTVSTAVLDYVRQQCSLTVRSLSEEREALHEQVIQWGRMLREEATGGAQNIAQALDRVGIKMSNSHFDYLQKFEAMKAEMDQQAVSQLQDTIKVAESLATSQQQALDLVAEQNAVIRENGQVLSDLRYVSHDAVQLISTINVTLSSLKDLELDQRGREIVQAMEIHKKEVEASISALDRSAEITKDVLAAQTSLHNSVSKLHETGFEVTLREFRDSLTDLKPVLENLREPFILQAVPIKKNGVGA